MLIVPGVRDMLDQVESARGYVSSSDKGCHQSVLDGRGGGEGEFPDIFHIDIDSEEGGVRNPVDPSPQVRRVGDPFLDCCRLCEVHLVDERSEPRVHLCCMVLGCRHCCSLSSKVDVDLLCQGQVVEDVAHFGVSSLQVGYKVHDLFGIGILLQC